jgi:hypothetical protein
MSLTTVAELRSTLGVGTLYPDATLQEVCDASEEVLLPMLWQNEFYNTYQSNTDLTGTLYFSTDISGFFYIGQTVTITKNAALHNGTKIITSIGTNNISYAVTGSPTEQGIHITQPVGCVTVTTQDYSTDAAVQNASLMIAVDIWQARTATLSGSNLVDFQPSPYRMSAQLLAKVRGLIAHAISPNSMVG